MYNQLKIKGAKQEQACSHLLILRSFAYVKKLGLKIYSWLCLLFVSLLVGIADPGTVAVPMERRKNTPKPRTEIGESDGKQHDAGSSSLS